MPVIHDYDCSWEAKLPLPPAPRDDAECQRPVVVLLSLSAFPTDPSFSLDTFVRPHLVESAASLCGSMGGESDGSGLLGNARRGRLCLRLWLTLASSGSAVQPAGARDAEDSRSCGERDESSAGHDRLP